MVDFYGNMYGGRTQVSVRPSQPERQKNPVRVLGGMRVHGSHVKQVMIDDEMVDVPKIEYVKLLDDQLRDARQRLVALEDRYTRLATNYNKVLSKLQDMRQSLNGKVDRR